MLLLALGKLYQREPRRFAGLKFFWADCAAIGMAVEGPNGFLHTECCPQDKRHNETKEKCDLLNYHFQAELKPTKKVMNESSYSLLLTKYLFKAKG